MMKISRRNIWRMRDLVLMGYNEAGEDELEKGMVWYQEARQKACEIMDCHSLEKAAGVIAALSPLKTWENNLEIAELLIKKGERKHVGHLCDKAEAILNGADIPSTLNGNKITNFYFNIVDPWDTKPVTIDRHALRMAGLRHDLSLTTKQYEIVAQAYREAAKRKNILSNQMQAITWLVQRSKNKKS